MADEPKPKKPSFLKKLLARKPKPEKPFVLNQLQDLPRDRKSHANTPIGKVYAGSVPPLIGAVGPVSAAGSMGAVGGLFNFIAGWSANISIQNMINPTPYDLLGSKLDKRALQILQARLRVLTFHGPLIERIRRKDWQGSDTYPLVGKTTVNEIRDCALETYAEVMEGDESLPKVIENLERFIQEGGKKKSDKTVVNALQGRINVARRRYHWVDNWAGELIG